MRLSSKTATMAYAFALLLSGCNMSTSPEDECLSNLRQIDGAKEVWAREQHKGTNDVPTWEDLRQYCRAVPLRCRGGGAYNIGRIGEPCTCSVPGHTALRREFLKTHPEG